MGVFIAKIKDDDERWYKIVDQIMNDELSEIVLGDAVAYDPNNTEANQWFKIDGFDQKEGFLPLLAQQINAADLESLDRQQYDNIEFIAFFDQGRYYMQKITRGNYLKKKWFSWDGDILRYQEDEGIIYINPVPNCIYDTNTRAIYFMDIAKAYGIFSNLKLDYKAATDDEANRFLQSDIVDAQTLPIEKVGVSNRKRITSILTKYEAYTPNEKATLKEYIKKSVGANLDFDDNAKKFVVNTDTQLRLLLYGIQQRFYMPPLEDEVQVATSSTGISNVL
jgi:hypothetical protein